MDRLIGYALSVVTSKTRVAGAALIVQGAAELALHHDRAQATTRIMQGLGLIGVRDAVDKAIEKVMQGAAPAAAPEAPKASA